jgi:hypothetical protein
MRTGKPSIKRKDPWEPKIGDDIRWLGYDGEYRTGKIVGKKGYMKPDGVACWLVTSVKTLSLRNFEIGGIQESFQLTKHIQENNWGRYNINLSLAKIKSWYVWLYSTTPIEKWDSITVEEHKIKTEIGL